MGDVGFKDLRVTAISTWDSHALASVARHGYRQLPRRDAAQGHIREPSTSFFSKQLSIIRLFSSSNLSARLMVEPGPAADPFAREGSMNTSSVRASCASGFVSPTGHRPSHLLVQAAKPRGEDCQSHKRIRSEQSVVVVGSKSLRYLSKGLIGTMEFEESWPVGVTLPTSFRTGSGW